MRSTAKVSIPNGPPQPFRQARGLRRLRHPSSFPSLTGPLNHLDYPWENVRWQEYPFPSLTGPLNHLDSEVNALSNLHHFRFPSLTGPLNHLDKRGAYVVQPELTRFHP